MARFIVRRLILLVPILLGLSILVFLWIRALPAGPAESLLGERATPETIRQIEEQYGLDEPIHIQYWEYLKTVATGDLGTTIRSRRPVTSELRERFPATIELTIAAHALRGHLRHPARVRRRQALRHLGRPLEPGLIPARDLDPGLLPRDPAEVRLRGRARMVTNRGTDRRPDRHRAPDGLLHDRCAAGR